MLPIVLLKNIFIYSEIVDILKLVNIDNIFITQIFDSQFWKIYYNVLHDIENLKYFGNRLIDNIQLNQIDEVNKILTNYLRDSRILTTNTNIYSPIYIALLSSDINILNKIIDYIKDAKKIKVIMNAEMMGSIATIVEKHQSPHLTPYLLIDRFLKPLYTDESIEKLLELIGNNIYYF